MSDVEPMWCVPDGTAYRDPVSGIEIRFQVSKSGLRRVYLARFDEGVPGLMNRELDFNDKGECVGSGSGCGGCDLPLNHPEHRRDDADWWKEADRE